MPLKTERPAGGPGDELVAYVAHDLASARKAREALLAAGCNVLLPEAALVALFEGGSKTVPIKVPARELTKAIDAIDAAFPPAELVLPPAAEERSALEPSVAGDRDAVVPEAERLDEAAVRARQLDRAATRAALVAGMSFMLLGPGVIFALWALVSSLSCRSAVAEVKDPEVAARVRRRSGVALVLALVSTLGSLAAIVAFVKTRG